jgi:hypothetical protein
MTCRFSRRGAPQQHFREPLKNLARNATAAIGRRGRELGCGKSMREYVDALQ